MATNFPTTLDTITNPASSDVLNSPSHSTQHITENDAIEALEAKVGIDSSADTTSLDYKLKNISSSNPGHKHTLAQGATDVTASAAELNYSVGVTSAIQTQLNAKAADNAVVKLTGDQTVAGVKTFSSDPIVPDEAYSATDWNGSLEPPTKNAVRDKIESMAFGVSTFKNGDTTYDLSTASGTQNIAHGVGAIPKKVRLTALVVGAAGAVKVSTTVYNGTTQSSISAYGANNGALTIGNTFTVGDSANNTGYQTGAITLDATNIIIAWTKTGTTTGTAYILWEAEY